jgi:hypothetical protein
MGPPGVPSFSLDNNGCSAGGNHQDSAVATKNLVVEIYPDNRISPKILCPLLQLLKHDAPGSLQLPIRSRRLLDECSFFLFYYCHLSRYFF